MNRTTHPTIRTMAVSIGCVTDAELVARAQAGDQAAFGELVDRHRRPAFRAVLTVLGSHAEADDVTQDAFVLAWQRLASFRGDSSFRTWLLRIAWRQAINRRRSIWRWLKRTVDFAGEALGSDADGLVLSVASAGRASSVRGETAGLRTAGGLLSGSRSPEEIVVNRQLRRDIAQAIRGLTPKLRDTLLLAHSGEYSYEEIGALLHTSVGTVKWRVAEARRLVRIRLREMGHDELG